MNVSQTDSRRIVITGLGLITPLGNTSGELWEALSSGRSGVDVLSFPVGPSVPAKFGGEARGFTGSIDDFGELEAAQKKSIRKGLKVMCRECQMGLAAAQRAIHDARLPGSGLDPERTGVVFGSDYILSEPLDVSDGIRNCTSPDKKFEFGRWGTDGLPKMSPLWLLKYLPNMPASHIAIYNDMRGPNNSITHREAAGGLAVGEAFRVIARGHADVMVAGATGTRIHPLKTVHTVMQCEVAGNGVPPAQASRPFDLNRQGMVLSEGAGVLVLEELEHARTRGATIYAEIVGFGSSSVATRHGVGNRRQALANALRAALRDARMQPGDIGHIHAHGLSTRSSDAEEAAAISEVFGERAATVPLTAAKSYFGNLGAGSSIVELAASALALRHGRLFRLLNYTTPDPECPIAAVRSDDVSPGQSFVQLSVTPQGQASCIVARQA